MAIECGHWDNGLCRAGYFGGRPSPGTCARCVHNPAHVGPGIAPPSQESLVQLQRYIADLPTQDVTPYLRTLWHELHTRAANADDLSGEEAWLTGWLRRVPCGECQRHSAAWVAANPPDASSREAWFAWTWRLHQSVNERLGKAGISLEEAITAYNAAR